VSEAHGAVVLAYRVGSEPIDAIRDYTAHLAAAIAVRAPDLSVRTAFGDRDGAWELTDVRSGAVANARDFAGAVGGATWVLVQYNPFAYGRWGLAPWLPARLARLRRSGVHVALMCHEVYVPMHSARQALIGVPQRVQIAALAALSDVVLASTAAAAGQVRRWAPRARVVHAPVGSNLPDGRGERAGARGRLALSEGEIVLASFGTGHPARLLGHIAAAVDAVSEVTAVCVLNLGAGAPDLDVNSNVRMIKPGPLDPPALAALLAAADVCLLAYVDGVSTRRTTLASTLQQQVCVVASDGYNTDALLRDAPDAIRLTAAGSVEAFAAAAVELALDRSARDALARGGRELYERSFAWEPIAARVLDAMAQRH
jgi:glycosyltransferase involved in cell wall biosynthesis